MGARQILAELRRQLQRRATLRLATGYVLLAGLMGLVAAWSGDGLGTALDIPYLFAPIIACPVVAHRVLRDRETAVAEVVATTPLTRSQALLGSTLAALLLTPLLVVATLPVLYAVSAAIAPGGFVKLLIYPAWAVSMGTAAAAAGLLIGHLTPIKPRAGLAIALLTAFVWLLFGMGLGGAPNPPLAVAIARRLSPLSHVVQAEQIGILAGAPIELLLAPLVYAAVALTLLPFVALGLQHPSGWKAPLTARSGPTAAVLVLLAVTGAGLVTWTAPETESPRLITTFEQRTPDLWFETSLLGPPYDEAWGRDVSLSLELEVVGPPNGTVHLDELRLTSPRATFQPPEGLPVELVLDDVFRDHGRAWNTSAGHAGRNQATFTFQAEPDELFMYTEAELVLVLDGQTHRFDVLLRATPWHVDERAVWTGLAGAGLPLLAATRWLPARWNRW